MKYHLLTAIIIILSNDLVAQVSSAAASDEFLTLFFYNPSFEGVQSTTVLPSYWQSCQNEKYPIPDVQPGSFNVKLPAFSGKTYLGFTADETGRADVVMQKLTDSLRAGTCYRLSFHLAKSSIYLNQNPKTGELENFNRPLKIAIYGMEKGQCAIVDSNWLVETPAVHHDTWKKYTFFINPPKTFEGIIFKVTHLQDTLYNGNLLLDNLTPIIPVECSDLRVRSSADPKVRSTLLLIHNINATLINNGKRMKFDKKSLALESTTEGGRNIYLDNILNVFEKYPAYRLIIRVKGSSRTAKKQMVYLYNYIFKNSQLKAQCFDIQRFKAKDEQFIWSIETDDLALSFDTN